MIAEVISTIGSFMQALPEPLHGLLGSCLYSAARQSGCLTYRNVQIAAGPY